MAAAQEDPDLNLVQRLNLDSFRLFVPAYLLVYGATLTTLPPGVLTQDNPLRVPIGYGAVAAGLILMWLNSVQMRPSAKLLSFGSLGVLAAVAGVIQAAMSSLLSASVAALIAIGLFVIAVADDRRSTVSDRQQDYLIHLMAIAVGVQGLAFLFDVGSASRLQSLAAIPPVPYGALMVASALLVVAGNIRRPQIRALEWTAAAACGGSLLGLQVLAAVRVEPLYWWLSVSVDMLAIGLILSPLWRLRWAGRSWPSLRTRVAAALVTTATLSILGTAAIGMSTRSGELSSVLELLFAAIATCLLVVYAVGWWWGGRVAQSQTELAAALSSLNPGSPWRAPTTRRDAELDRIAREVEMLADRLVDEKAAAAHRATVSVSVERALSSSLKIETALTGLLDALVPAFCDAAGAYVRRGDAIVRLAIQGPEELTAVSTYPLRQEATMGPNAVIRTGKPEFYLDSVPGHYFSSVALDDEHRLDRLRVSSMMIVPIVGSDGRTDGAISVKLMHGDRKFSQYDVASLLDFASRAALAIENGRLYEEVAEASAAKDEFLGLVSHELRTPITTILGDAVLLRRERSPEQRTELAADIEAESTRLAEIVENLLSIARLGLTAEIAVEPTRLYPALIVAVSDARRLAAQREIGLRANARPIVESNESYLQIVMHNLLMNAVKYSDLTEPIEVVLDAVDGRAIVSILDRGPGLPESEVERIFEPFYQATGVRPKAGLGIGLTVCRRITAAIGGRIEAALRPGGGMIFRLSLPLAVFEDGDAAPLWAAGEQDEADPVSVGGDGAEASGD